MPERINPSQKKPDFSYDGSGHSGLTTSIHIGPEIFENAQKGAQISLNGQKKENAPQINVSGQLPDTNDIPLNGPCPQGQPTVPPSVNFGQTATAEDEQKALNTSSVPGSSNPVSSSTNPEPAGDLSRHSPFGATPEARAGTIGGGSAPSPQNVVTGMLRQDIELIRPGAHGSFAMLFDPSADVYYKISERSLEIITHLDRSYPIMKFLELLNGSGMQVTKAELVQLIAFLHQNSLLAPEYGQMEKKYEAYVKMRKDTTFLRFSAAYLFFRLPPLRPEKFYEKIRPFVSWMASKWFLLLLLLPAICGYVLMVRNFPEVRATFVNSLSWAGLAKYFVAIILMKVVHECAHSIAAIHFKCRVRGVGIGFMVFYPRLYTDTTDSWRLPRKQRLLIDGAGILIELLVGGIAALVWAYAPTGVLKSTMFYIFAVSTISTLFVNGNPCIRYDGYYILCDVMNIENLMTRSSEYVKQCWHWYFLRLGTSPKDERGAFLLFFGIISFIYRIFLYTSIILVIYNQFVPAVAICMLFLELFSIFIYPMYKEIKTVRMLSKKSANKARFFLFFAMAAVIAAVLFLPLSWNVDLVGEIVPVSQSQMVVMEGGYLNRPLPSHPVMVNQGDRLYDLSSPILDFAIQRNLRDCDVLKVMLNLQQLSSREQERAAADITEKNLASNASSRAELQLRRRRLNADAPHSGFFVPNFRDNVSENCFLPKGALVGQVVNTQKMVYAYAEDRALAKIQLNDRVRIRVKDSLKDFYGTVADIKSVPAQLRNSPLLQQFGGPIPVYPDEHHSGEFISVLPLYQIDIAFDDQPDLQFGRTVQLEVIHTERLYDTIRQYLISVFRREFK